MSVLKRAGILENFLFDQKNTSMSVQEVPKEAELQHLGICILTVIEFVFFVVEKNIILYLQDYIGAPLLSQIT